jgi:hypothetical protein
MVKVAVELPLVSVVRLTLPPTLTAPELKAKVALLYLAVPPRIPVIARLPELDRVVIVEVKVVV